MNLFLEVFLDDKNIITKLVGFCYLHLNDKISDLLRSAFGIAPPHPQETIAPSHNQTAIANSETLLT
ncbi:MAG: hypothetical protein EWV55_04880 [Microcystis viridis Mv_BB_P_19951000_S69]|uniref:Uncharacterized protein n=1 Tax=Microcystis viridis Mv_BB_P_19951000_S68D TaxID=2486270 RepID=A0A552HKI6_MICVR|nr:MAG: hypothetical protein EWV77_14740 [Microcystis viridis Mv_BB_P_19951000_S68D]TRU72434.1 MAG: hypothetical protein EWV47_15170 [Microcystis viridis Mv_BB_P_19951000_S68]TRU77441.1 MAG: hypothetical protein EWV55_04880 [Microcystis viridis Mv_BB_P_19951000_S69]TRU88256.1 MAG: hypothetical protein EWV46_06380 [Microcystis viridis Mv_BB_P_19951000_S69D]